MKNISSAFVKAQAGFAPALKTSTNPHFKSKYADLAACVEAVIDSLNSNGIALIQRTFEDSGGVTVETVFLHESGEMLEGGKLHVPAAKQDPQGYGSALSYARRYSLMAACGIAPEDDDGNAASKVAKATKPLLKRPPPQNGVKADVLSQHPPLTKDETDYLDEMADEIIGDVERGIVISEVHKKVEETGLSIPQKVYLSALLPASIVASLRKEAEEKHKVPA
jgi:hypothetical protein